MAKLSQLELAQLAKKIGGDITVEQIVPVSPKSSLLADAREGTVKTPGLKALRSSRVRAASLRGSRPANLKADSATKRSKVLPTDIAVKVKPKSGVGPEKIMIFSGKTKELLLQQG